MDVSIQNHASGITTAALERARGLTLELHAQLVALQQQLADAERSGPPPCIDPLAAALLSRYAELTELDALMDAETRARVVLHHHTLVQPFFMSVPLARRSLDQPLGYPGDYMMVEMLFGGGPVPGSPLGDVLGEVLLQSAPSQAHRYRAPWANGWLARRARELQRPLRVLSFACGPERILRVHVETAREPIHVALCDHEPLALAHARATLAPLLSAGSRLHSVELSVAGLLRGRAHAELLCGPFAEGFDVILVLGLFDYLRDSLVLRLMKGFHDLMSDDGVVLTSNLHAANPHRALMEYVVNWKTTHRSHAEFEALMLGSRHFEPLEHTTDPTAANLLFAGRARA